MKKAFSQLADIKFDIPAGLVVFLVAIPLCLGIALASGAPPISGIIAGIIGGLVVALISGSPLGVSGPAAGLAAIVFAAIGELGGFELFLVAVVLAGLIQIGLGVLRLGIIAYFFPSSVIKGMLSGIGIIIILKEIPYALGADLPRKADGTLELGTFESIAFAMENIAWGPTILTLGGLAVLILWTMGFMKKLSFTQWIQGPLVAVVLGVVLYYLFAGGEWAFTKAQLVDIPVASEQGGILSLITTPDWTALKNPAVYITAITIAVVASLETLLCVEATDKLDPQKRVTPTNRELIAQGVGNTLSGLIGGLPLTQVIVRSSANIQSGGKTKMAAFYHGALILICVLAIPFVLNSIPLAALAAILFIVGYKLAKPSIFKAMWNQGLSEFLPFIATIGGIVFLDLLKGIGIGMAIAVFFILMRSYKIPFLFKEGKDNKSFVLELSNHVSFMHKAGIQKSLNELPDGCHITIDASRNRDIHHDVHEIILDFRSNAESRNIDLELIGIDDNLNEKPLDEFIDMVRLSLDKKKDEHALAS